MARNVIENVFAPPWNMLDGSEKNIEAWEIWESQYGCIDAYFLKMQIPLSLETQIGGMLFPEMMCSCQHCKFILFNFSSFSSAIYFFMMLHFFCIPSMVYHIYKIYYLCWAQRFLQCFGSWVLALIVALMQPTNCPTFDL